MSADSSATNVTLLGRLRRNPTDQEAWNAFVDRYGKKIYSWCRRWTVQQADAQDITQNVLMDLARQMRGFEYRNGGSFRGWLKIIAHRAWCDFLSARQRTLVVGGDDEALRQLRTPSASDDLLKALEEECDRELLEEAMARVRLRVQPHTWQAFELTALENQSGADVASKLGMNVGTVYVARGKVQRMLQEEVQRLEQMEAD